MVDVAIDGMTGNVVQGVPDEGKQRVDWTEYNALLAQLVPGQNRLEVSLPSEHAKQAGYNAYHYLKRHNKGMPGKVKVRTVKCEDGRTTLFVWMTAGAEAEEKIVPEIDGQIVQVGD